MDINIGLIEENPKYPLIQEVAQYLGVKVIDPLDFIDPESHALGELYKDVFTEQLANQLLAYLISRQDPQLIFQVVNAIYNLQLAEGATEDNLQLAEGATEDSPKVDGGATEDNPKVAGGATEDNPKVDGGNQQMILVNTTVLTVADVRFLQEMFTTFTYRLTGDVPKDATNINNIHTRKELYDI